MTTTLILTETEQTDGEPTKHEFASRVHKDDSATKKLRNKEPASDCTKGEKLPYLPIDQSHIGDRKLIGVHGLWYDVTAFTAYHPGGDVIEKFVGKDATALVDGMHNKNVLARRKPVARYSHTDLVQQKFLELAQWMKDHGYYKTDYNWYARKTAFTFSFLIATLLLITQGPNVWIRLLGGVALAGFWQQCGFHMHDFMHNQVLHDRKWDQRLGTFFGTFCMGVSGSWWRDEHFVHHSLTNTVDHQTGFIDPQQNEDVWAHNEKLFPFYKTKFKEFLIRIQHITFLPICVFAGRTAIIIDALSTERRWYEWLAFVGHVLWTSLLLSYLPTWTEILVVYFLASSLQGILHVQLLLNHYMKDFFYLQDVCNEQNWYKMQVETNINIRCPRWLDWFHGGLNLHIEHHLFPNMPRHNFRKASWHVKSLCKELDIEYEEVPMSQAIWRLLKHLRTCGQLFSLDPR